MTVDLDHFMVPSRNKVAQRSYWMNYLGFHGTRSLVRALAVPCRDLQHNPITHIEAQLSGPLSSPAAPESSRPTTPRLPAVTRSR